MPRCPRYTLDELAHLLRVPRERLRAAVSHASAIRLDAGAVQLTEYQARHALRRLTTYELLLEGAAARR